MTTEEMTRLLREACARGSIWAELAVMYDAHHVGWWNGSATFQVAEAKALRKDNVPILAIWTSFGEAPSGAQSPENAEEQLVGFGRDPKGEQSWNDERAYRRAMSDPDAPFAERVRVVWTPEDAAAVRGSL